MANQIRSYLKLSSQLLIEKNYPSRNTMRCSCKGKCGTSSDHMNSHFCVNPIVRSISIAMLSLLGVGILVTLSVSAYAQDPNPPGNVSESSEESDIVLNTTSADIPVLEKPSDKGTYIVQLRDKGTYIVQLRWSQSPSLLPADGFDMEVVFLNASAPRATSQTFPTTETNQSDTVGSTGYTDPSLIERMVPIKSYDITIYSDDGRELWKKENQAVQGGRSHERVTLEEPYTGNITISIQNIEGTGGLSGTIAEPLSKTTSNLTSPMTNTGDLKNQTQSSESVNFSARVM
jgi:hypothetical protein